MNILFLTRLYSPHVGGVEKHIKELSKILSQKHNIIIVTEQYSKKLKKYQCVKDIPLPKWNTLATPVTSNSKTHKQIKIYRIPVYNKTEKNKKWRIWKWWALNLNLVKQADIVHVHDVFFWLLPFRRLFPFKKIFITFHGYEGNQPPSFKAKVQRKIAEIFTNGNICIGEFMTKWYGTKPTLISYGAANISPSPLPKKHQAIFVARLDHDTGILDYIKGISLLTSPIKLTVYGDGPLKKSAQKLAQKHKLPITFKGPTLKAMEEIKKYRLAFASRYLSILEAMQTKRLVFAHYNNQIKHDYLTCHPQAKNMIIFTSPQQLAQKLKMILNKPKLERQKIEKAYQWAKQQTWQKLTKQYQNLWTGKRHNADARASKLC